MYLLVFALTELYLFSNAPIDPYNIAYYPRDTRRAPTPIIAAVRDDYEAKPGETVLPGDLKEIEGAIAASKEEDQQSSPGNKGTFATGKSDFDPTGLRAAMSTNHAAVEESLKQYLPNGGMPAHVSWISMFAKYLF